VASYLGATSITGSKTFSQRIPCTTRITQQKLLADLSLLYDQATQQPAKHNCKNKTGSDLETSFAQR